jgi:hypothetical protein
MKQEMHTQFWLESFTWKTEKEIGGQHYFICLFTNLFIPGLFNDIFISSDYTASNYRINEQLIGKDMEGDGRGLF